MELQRFVWSWEMATSRLRSDDPVAGFALQSACRPIATDRRKDGTLLLVIGCWYPYHRDLLAGEQSRAHLIDKFTKYFGDRIDLRLVDWPGGLVPEDDPAYRRSRALIEAAKRPGSAVELLDVDANPPPIVISESDEALGEAAKCESAIHRLFFARLLARSILCQCQHQVLHYRLDFAVPTSRAGAEILGWDGRLGVRQHRIEFGRERDQNIAAEGWSVLTFSGAEVYRDPNGCVDEFVTMIADRRNRRDRPRGPIRDPRARR